MSANHVRKHVTYRQWRDHLSRAEDPEHEAYESRFFVLYNLDLFGIRIPYWLNFRRVTLTPPRNGLMWRVTAIDGLFGRKHVTQFRDREEANQFFLWKVTEWRTAR